MQVIDKIKQAIKNRRIEDLLVLVDKVSDDDIAEAYHLYSQFHEKELILASTIQEILMKTKKYRLKNPIPKTGNHTFRLEE